jgi:hypothetical protein
MNVVKQSVHNVWFLTNERTSIRRTKLNIVLIERREFERHDRCLHCGVESFQIGLQRLLLLLLLGVRVAARVRVENRAPRDRRLHVKKVVVEVLVLQGVISRYMLEQAELLHSRTKRQRARNVAGVLAVDKKLHRIFAHKAALVRSQQPLAVLDFDAFVRRAHLFRRTIQQLAVGDERRRFARTRRNDFRHQHRVVFQLGTPVCRQQRHETAIGLLRKQFEILRLELWKRSFKQRHQTLARIERILYVCEREER